MVTSQDEQGRDLKATLQGDGFVWEVWANLDEKENHLVVVMKRLPNNFASVVGQLELNVPLVMVNYPHLLKNFVENCARPGCGHSESEHQLETGGTGPCRHDFGKHIGFVPQKDICKCIGFQPRDPKPRTHSPTRV